jgi:hypothetical protein
MFCLTVLNASGYTSEYIDVSRSVLPSAVLLKLLAPEPFSGVDAAVQISSNFDIAAYRLRRRGTKTERFASEAPGVFMVKRRPLVQ